MFKIINVRLFLRYYSKNRIPILGELPKCISQYLILAWDNKFPHFLKSLMSCIVFKIKTKLDGDYKCFSSILRTWVFFRKFVKMLKASMLDYEKLSLVTYPH